MNISQVSKLLFYFAFGRSGVKVGNSTHKKPFGNRLFEPDRIQFIVIFCNQVKYIAKNHRIG